MEEFIQKEEKSHPWNIRVGFLKIILPEKPLQVLYTNGHHYEYELDVSIKLKLKVCFLQLYQKLSLPKISLVPCFVGVLCTVRFMHVID